MRSNTIEVNGIRMRWEEEGEGRPVVFVHGIPTSPRLWRRVIPHVQNARSIAFEMVGYGASIEEGRNRDISVAQQAEYLASFMRQTEIGSAIVVGHDLGGGVAQILAVRHPELVDGLVFTNAIAYDSWPISGVKAMRAMGPLVERLPVEVFRYILRAFLQGGHDDSSRAKESFDEHWPYYEAGGGGAAFVRQARSLNQQDTVAVADQIPNLDVPARLAWGTADQFQPVGYGYRLAYELGAPIQRIEGGKHFTPEDHPEEIADAVNDLVRELG